MDKQSLRQEMLARTNQLKPLEKLQIEKNMYQQLFVSSQWEQAKCIGLTYAQSFEWSTKPIMEAAWEDNKKVALPRCTPLHHRLDFYQIHHENQLEKGFANLMEPNVNNTNKINKNDINLLIVPGIVFDQYGYRIGFGGGYYDRFLADFPGTTLSLASEFQICDTIPKDNFDIPVHFLCTEKTILHAQDREV